MNLYLTQLLADIRAAQRPEEPNIQPLSLDVHFAEVEAWLAGEMEEGQTFGRHCGLDPVQFPPAEKLTGIQMKDLVQALDLLLFSWNITTDIPDGVPIGTTYRLLVGLLDRQVTIMSSGFTGIEFCQYDSATCPFGETWCRCCNFEP